MLDIYKDKAHSYCFFTGAGGGGGYRHPTLIKYQIKWIYRSILSSQLGNFFFLGRNGQSIKMYTLVYGLWKCWQKQIILIWAICSDFSWFSSIWQYKIN